MAQWRITDNTRETFVGANSTTITPTGAAQNSRSFAGASWASGDFGPIVARAGAEISAGIFTYNGTAFTQTTPLYSSNSNSAVTFSSGNQGEVYCDLLAAWVEFINFTEISVASATTCDIGGTAVQGAKVLISGTASITSLGTGTNKFRLARFSGILTLTHNATSLILPGGANIATAAGDTAIFLSDSSGNWRCWAYQKANGKPLIIPVPVADGGTGDTGTAWTSYVPTIAAGTGTLTSVAAVGRYKQIGKTVFIQIMITITTNGTAALYISATLPGGMTEYSATVTQSLSGREGVNGFSVNAFPSGGLVYIKKYDGTYPGASGNIITIAGAFEVT